MNRLSLYLTAPRDLTFTEELLPELTADEVLVKTLYGAVSLGTELPLYSGTSRSSEAIIYPTMTGYESYGVIEAIGKKVKDFHVGDKVVSFYGHRTHAVVKVSNLIRVPATLSPALALLAILSCDAKKGILKLEPRVNETVLITGAGTIGLLTLFILKALGVQVVDVIEPLSNRRELALALGARNIFNNTDILSQTYDVGIECSSRNNAFTTLQAHLNQNGRICIRHLAKSRNSKQGRA